jgi:predicted alpha/beta-hydrolase family hydrolase
MLNEVEAIHETSAEPAVRGFVHRPSRATGNALVLTHGAGSDANAPLLVALGNQFAECGWTVLRCNLPYRQARPTGPPRGSDKQDRAGLRRAVEVMQSRVRGGVFLGGMSYGGRQATLLVAEEPQRAAGLLILSYPLHPPGRPEQLRTKHLPQIRVPALFVSGNKDPFGSPEEMQAAVRLLPGKTDLMIVEGAGHDLGYGRRAKSKATDLPRRVVGAFLELLGF